MAIATGIALGIVTFGVKGAISAPAGVFLAHLDTIQKTIPSDFTLRLPAKILLNEPADEEFIQKLRVKPKVNESPSSVTIDLLSCEDDQERCWIGSFAVASTNSITAQKAYQRHLRAAAPIRLSPDVRAYVLDDIPKYPSVKVSSVMWQQDGMFYSAEFATPERQNMLYMALSMVNSEPVYAPPPMLQKSPSQARP